MLESYLSPSAYYHAEQFETEKRSVFENVWEFAGYTFEVPQLNDFKLIQRAGREVLIQRTRDGVQAFLNVCPHRFARIQTEAKGNRPLICGYHGWSFGPTGQLAGLPRKETFDDGEKMRSEVCLTKFELVEAGQLLFVKVGQSPLSFDEYFGAEAEFLRKVGSAIDATVDTFVAEIPANWKLLIENSLEGYHVPMVHAATLGQFEGMSRRAEDIVDHVETTEIPAGQKMTTQQFGRFAHSYMMNKAESVWLERFRKIAKGAGTWPFQADGYIHHLFFPNLTITTFLGYSFHVQHFEAVGPELTRVHSRIFSTRFEGGLESVRKSIFGSMFGKNIDFTHDVFKEDESVVISMQKGIRDVSHQRRAVLSSLEKRIWAFQQAFRFFN